MGTGYSIDLGKISMDDLQETLSTGIVLPSRLILKEDLQHRFDIIRSFGINDLDTLLNELKNKKKIEDFAERSSLPVEYLTILRREVNSYLSKPISLSKIPGVDDATLEALASIGIRSSKNMVEKGRTRSDRSDLSKQTGISEKIILDLVKMSDISRIIGVGPVFTRTFLNSGVDTVEKVSNSDAEVLYKKMVELYKEQGFDKIDFVIRDIQWCIDMAQKLPRTIEW